MLSLFPARSLCGLSRHARRLATEVSASTAVTPHATAATSDILAEDKLPLRPHLRIKVDRNHGLFAFFRRTEKEGKVSYATVEPVNIVSDKSGRSWTAPELRRKSFKDLHTLWYVVLRERNLLATQQAEARRLGANEQTLGLWPKVHRCRKTMARIKYIINERRLAYEGALKIHAAKHERALLEEEQAKNGLRPVEKAVRAEKTKRRSTGERMEDIAARSLFETVPADRKS